jgi:shikimate kinase
MKTIYILIGAKGSGKSFVGKLAEKEFGIPFLSVENLVKDIKKDREVTNELYRIEAFAVIENNVREFLSENSSVIFESVGVTHQFDTMLESLKEDFNVITIGIKTDPNLCLERFRTRDSSNHVNLSVEEVKMINSAFYNKNMRMDFIIDNNNKSADEIIAVLDNIINR